MAKLFVVALVCFAALSHAFTPPPTATALEKVLQIFLNGLGADDIDVTTCVTDLHGAEKAIGAAVVKFRAHATGDALNALGLAVHDMSIAVTPCEIAEAPARLNQLAEALHLATVQWLDGVAKIWVADAEAEILIESMISSWEAKDYDGFEAGLAALAIDLANLLHCKETDKACLVLQSILTETAKITTDFGPCIVAVTPLAIDLEKFYTAYKAGDIIAAVKNLNAFLTNVGKAAAPCHLQDLENLLVKSSNKLATVTVSSSGNIVYGNIDITKDIIALIKAMDAGDYKEVGVEVSKLLVILRANGCDSKMCNVMDGLLQAMGIIAYDMGGCKTTLEAAEGNFTAAVSAFHDKQYKVAVYSLQYALASMAAGVDSCQLGAIGSLIDQEAAKFGLGNVTIIDGAVSILIEGADIYSPLNQAILAFEAHQYGASGAALGDLVNVLRKTACKSEDKACIFIEGLLQGLEIVVSDLGQCSAELVVAADKIESSLADFKSKNYKQGVKDLAVGLDDLAKSVRLCQLPELADVIVAQAGKLGVADIQIVADIVHVIVEGADVYGDLFDAAEAFDHGDFVSAGKSLSSLLTDTKLATCKTAMCEFITSVIQAITTIAPDLAACETKLEAAWADFELVGTSIRSGHELAALKALSRGLEATATAIQPCDLPEEAAILARIAQELGFNSIGKDITGAIVIIVSGADIYDGIFQAGGDIANKDYDAAGRAIGRVLQDILKWHDSNGCTTPMCFILEGMTKALGILESDFKTCEADIELTWVEFGKAISAFKKHKAFSHASNGTLHGTRWNRLSDDKVVTSGHFLEPSSSGNLPVVSRRGLSARRLSWWSDLKKDFKNLVDDVENDVTKDWNAVVGKLKKVFGDDNVKTGFEDLAIALDDVAISLKACHAEELGIVVAKLALELGVPAVGWIAEAFNIILNGAQLYDDAYNAVVDYEAKNYIGMGYELAKFAILVVKTL